MKKFLLLPWILILFAACTATPTPPAEPTTPAGDLSPAAAPGSASGPTAVAVTYFTPAQQEGPYYPVDKPADQDNDLVMVAGSTGNPAGQILEFGGTLYDARGLPVNGAVIEIWQTDSNGIYRHPNDPGTELRDPHFQFYGEAQTNADGQYRFRTIMPGRYEPRPRHIHVKVKLNGAELLITQFYFAEEINLRGDEAALLISTTPGQDEDGNMILTGQRDIILNFNPPG